MLLLENLITNMFTEKKNWQKKYTLFIPTVIRTFMCGCVYVQYYNQKYIAFPKCYFGYDMKKFPLFVAFIYLAQTNIK